MKNSQKTTSSKLLIRYDNTLKALLMQDLKAFRKSNGNNRAIAQQAA